MGGVVHARSLREYVANQAKLEKLRRLTGPAYWLRRDLFDRQLAFVDDPSRRKTARCGRRAGKTHLDAAYALLAAHAAAEKQQRRDITVPYVALTKGHARRLAWPTLHALNDRYALGLKFQETELSATWPTTGARVWLTGADHPAEIEKLRGGAYPLVIVDEGASFGARLGYLIDEVLDAALADYDGTVAITGSPGAACAGKFFEADTSADALWSRHAWTVLDNPNFPRWAGALDWRAQAKQFLAAKRLEQSWREDNPIYQREWLGRWLRDSSSLVYRWDDALNSYEVLPQATWRYIIGVDLGFDDPTAFSVTAWSDDLPTAYLVDEHKASGLSVSSVVAKIKELRDIYKPIRIVADTGGLGKMIVDECNSRHQLAILPAQKTAKNDFIELLNDDLRTGKFKALRDSNFASQAKVLQRDAERPEKEDERFENDACDSTLYAWREMRHYRYVEPVDRPPPGTTQHSTLSALAERQRRLKRIQGAAQKPWWRN